MRTTITLDDDLLRIAKERALERKTTLGHVIEDALRAFLLREEASQQDSQPFRLITFRGDGPQPGVHLDKTAELIEQDDVKQFGE